MQRVACPKWRPDVRQKEETQSSVGLKFEGRLANANAQRIRKMLDDAVFVWALIHAGTLTVFVTLNSELREGIRTNHRCW